MQAIIVGACMLVRWLQVTCRVLSMTNNCKLCAHEIAFLSFMFPDHGACMSFAARVQKSHMVFTPLDLPYSEMVVNGDRVNGVHWNRLTSGARSCESMYWSWRHKVLGRTCHMQYYSKEANMVTTVIELCNWFV